MPGKWKKPTWKCAKCAFNLGSVFTGPHLRDIESKRVAALCPSCKQPLEFTYETHMNLKDAIQRYQSCPYTQLSLPGLCDDCQLNQSFNIKNKETNGGQFHTTPCRLLEALQNNLSMIGEDKGKE